MTMESMQEIVDRLQPLKKELRDSLPKAVLDEIDGKEKLVEIVVHQQHSTKTFEGRRSDTDVYGAIASRFNYELLGIDKNRVIEIGKRKFFTDIHDFHNALKNEDYSVFNANQYLDTEPEFYVIPLG